MIPRPLCLYAWHQTRRFARDTLLLGFVLYLCFFLFYTAHTLHPLLLAQTQPHAHDDAGGFHHCHTCAESLPGIFTCRECLVQTRDIRLVALTPAAKDTVRRRLLIDAMQQSWPLRALGCTHHASVCFSAMLRLTGWLVFDAPEVHPVSVLTGVGCLLLVCLWCWLLVACVHATHTGWRRKQAELDDARALAVQSSEPMN